MPSVQPARSLTSVLAGALLLLATCALPATAAIAPPSHGPRSAATAPAARTTSPAPGPRTAVPKPGPRTAVPKPGPRTAAAALEGNVARPAGCASATPAATHRGTHAASTRRASARPGATRVGGPIAHCYLAYEPAPAQAAARAATCSVSVQNGWSPCNLRSAYKISSLVFSHGGHQTIAVIDAYNDPNAGGDLAAYRARFGLPRCPASNGCFKKVNQSGAAGPYPPGNMGWGQEISLDLDMVSAICPRCHILLVEANTSGFGDLFTAIQEAINLGAHVITASWGVAEFSGESSYDGTLNAPGVAITDSSGDGAFQAGVQYPSASPYVTSVGGTALIPSTNKRAWQEKTWVTAGTPPTQGSGSGCSSYESKPTWQDDAGCSMRTTADVSAVASNVLGYDTYETGGGGWYFFFGTSVSSPIIAGMYGLAGNARGQTVAPASLAYANTNDLYDIRSGLATGTCSPLYLCNAVKGYDGPTGLGTPHGIGAF